MKRSTWLGSGISPLIVVLSSSRCSFITMTRPMFGMNGNGCAGSIASGVRMGNTRSMNQAASHSLSAACSPDGVADHDTGLGQQAAQLVPGGLLHRHQGGRTGLDLAQLLRRGAAVGGERGDARLGLSDQPGNADQSRTHPGWRR